MGRGRAAEKKVKDQLENSGIKVDFSPTKKFDLIIYEPFYNVEVKKDWMECKTGNVAIEYHNTITDKPSGPLHTGADIIFYVFKDGIRVTNNEILREIVELAHRTVENAGDGNANIVLVKRAVFDDKTIPIEEFISILIAGNKPFC